MTFHDRTAADTVRRRRIALATITALIVIAVTARSVPGTPTPVRGKINPLDADGFVTSSTRESACESSTTTTHRSNTMIYRFISWLAIGIAGAFLVVATTAFSLSEITWLAFAVSIGTLVVAIGLGYGYRRHTATLLTASAVAGVSAWTIVASQVFSATTVQTLALAGALAVSGLAILGVTEHEVSNEQMLAQSGQDSPNREGSLAAAA